MKLHCNKRPAGSGRGRREHRLGNIHELLGSHGRHRVLPFQLGLMVHKAITFVDQGTIDVTVCLHTTSVQNNPVFASFGPPRCGPNRLGFLASSAARCEILRAKRKRGSEKRKRGLGKDMASLGFALVS